ncbi:transposase [Streptomyces sp. NBC_01320]|uniref:transposase n=1 Tax=Streptomyces sp. NBC_01320 TaxID=2903824 RepID=UPI002E0F11EE|nr:transposase [Streptomyces sp. NBC_01320]
MTMVPQPWPEPTAEVARAVRARFHGREMPLPVAVRDRFGELFADVEFASAFGVTGPSGWSPGRLSLVTVFQMAENLTDRQAAEAVRDRLSWAYALGLDLADTGFDHTVLSEFRSRVVAHHLEEKVLDLLLARLKEMGLVEAGGKQRADSTSVVAAVRDLNRLELVGESVRALVETLAAAAPDWLAQVIDVPGWSRRYGRRVDSWKMPASKTKQDALAIDYARDGFALLGAVYAPEQPGWLRELPAAQVLRIVLLQNYTRTTARNGREVVKRREKNTEDGDGLPPGSTRLASPYDTDTRWSAKRDAFWNGYKVHISETCATAADDAGRTEHVPPTAKAAAKTPRRPKPDRAPRRPNVITNVATTALTLPDSKALEGIHQSQQRRGLLPDEHYIDSGYPSAELITGSAARYGVALITPVLLDTSRQAKAKEGFAAHDFTIDWENHQAVCPTGNTSTAWTPNIQNGVTKTVVSFAALDCIPCPFKQQCTTAKSNRRQLSLHPPQMTEALRHARARQQTKDWNTDYALRAGVEGTIRQAVAVTDLHQARYRGLAKTHLEHVYSAVALNLIRLDAWWNGHPLDRTRTSHLARLELRLAA